MKTIKTFILLYVGTFGLLSIMALRDLIGFNYGMFIVSFISATITMLLVKTGKNI